MGFFDLFRPKPTRAYGGEVIVRALRPWLSEALEARGAISPNGRYKNAWVNLERSADVVTVKYKGAKVGEMRRDMPDCGEVIDLINRLQIDVATVLCYEDYERGRDGYRAILNVGRHKYEPRPPFKRLEYVE